MLCCLKSVQLRLLAACLRRAPRCPRRGPHPCLARCVQLRGIVATFRMTSRAPPSRPSHYVSMILAPLNQFLQVGRRRTRGTGRKRGHRGTACRGACHFVSVVDRQVQAAPRCPRPCSRSCHLAVELCTRRSLDCVLNLCWADANRGQSTVVCWLAEGQQPELVHAHAPSCPGLALCSRARPPPGWAPRRGASWPPRWRPASARATCTSLTTRSGACQLACVPQGCWHGTAAEGAPGCVRVRR